jgi:hypothetical protein
MILSIAALPWYEKRSDRHHQVERVCQLNWYIEKIAITFRISGGASG